jgi:hypothetical protein
LSHRAWNFLFEVVGAVHVLQNVDWNVHSSAELVLNSDLLIVDFSDSKICGLRKPLSDLELFSVPKRLLWSSWLTSVDSCTYDVRCGFYKILINLGTRFLLDCFGQIAYNDLWLLGHDKFVSILHYINH